MPLSTQDVIKLSQQSPLTTGQVQNLATQTAPAPTGTSAITPSAMTPATPIQPVVATQPPIPTLPENPPPPAPATPTAPPPTPLADQLSALIGDTVKGNNALLGKSADTTALNESMGVNAQNDVITGLSSQLTGLINEAKAIPLQIQQNAQAGGANVTKGGLAPIQTAQLRNNAIQALSVSSLIDASRGALDVAMKKVDRALEAKYGPLEEANKARIANLDLLSKDPALTREEKARVDFLTAQTKASDAKIADAKAVETAKHDAVLKAYADFSTNPKFDNITQAAINAAKTDTEVAQILAHQGLSTAPMAPGFELSPGQARYDASGKLIAQLAPLPAKVGTSSTGGYTVDGKVVSPELQQMITDGKIDPNRLNSRTLPIYNELAQSQTNTVASHAGVAAKTKAYQDAITYASLARRTTSVLDKNMPLIYATADKVNQLGVPGLDNIIRGAKSYTGNNVDVIKYVNTLKTLRSEYANMLAKGTQVTDSVRQEAADAIPAGLSSDGYRALTEQLNLETANIIQAADESAQSIFNQPDNTTQLKSGATGTTKSGISYTIE